MIGLVRVALPKIATEDVVIQAMVIINLVIVMENYH